MARRARGSQACLNSSPFWNLPTASGLPTFTIGNVRFFCGTKPASPPRPPAPTTREKPALFFRSALCGRWPISRGRACPKAEIPVVAGATGSLCVAASSAASRTTAHYGPSCRGQRHLLSRRDIDQASMQVRWLEAWQKDCENPAPGKPCAPAPP